MKKLLILLLIISILPLVSSEVYEINKPTALYFTCTLNNQIPSASTTYNITITSVRNGTKLVDNEETTALGQGLFEYNITFTEKGFYNLNQFCYDGIYNYSSSDIIEVTGTGSDLSTAKVFAYILIFFILLLAFIILLVSGIYLPVSNSRDEMTGYILAINNLKYVKLLCLSFAYLIAVFISFFSYSIARAYLDFDFLTSISYFAFIFLTGLILPFFIMMTYLLITNWVKDNKIHELLMRGLKVK